MGAGAREDTLVASARTHTRILTYVLTGMMERLYDGMTGGGGEGRQTGTGESAGYCRDLGPLADHEQW